MNKIFKVFLLALCLKTGVNAAAVYSSLNASNLSGTLGVSSGGTGAATLTGIVKGNGTSAFTAVTAPSGTIVGTTDTQTLTNKTLTSPTINTPIIIGISSGSSAGTGVVGEVKKSSKGSGAAISLTTNQYADVASVNVTAGDWEISIVGVFGGGAVTGTQSLIGVGTVAGNDGTGLTVGDTAIVVPTIPTATSDIGLSLAQVRVNPTGTTVYYLKVRSVFTVGTATAYGRISARRIR